MPRNGSGEYSLPVNDWNPAVDGVSATPNGWNQTAEDLASAISASISADGQTPIAGNLRMGNYILTGLGPPSAPGHALRREQIMKGANIASATSILIPVEGSLFVITGTTTITTIADAFPGRSVFLIFSEELTIRSSVNLLLPNGRDIETVAGMIIEMLQTAPGVWEMVSSGGDGAEIGDFKDTLRTLDEKWLRRNGAIYNIADYPELGALSSPLPAGVAWTTVDSGLTSGYTREIVDGPAGTRVGISLTGTITRSVDGGPWEIVSSPSLTGNVVSFAYGNGMYVITMLNIGASLGQFIYSTDLENWSAPAAFEAGWSGYPNLAFGNGVFVAAGRGSGDPHKIWTSSDGQSWTLRYTSEESDCYEVSFAGDIFIVLSQGGSEPFAGNILTSSNGTIWTVRPTGATVSLLAAAYSKGTYIVAGSNGVILSSINLSTWVPRSSGISDQINFAIGNELGFLVGGNNGKALIADPLAIGWFSTTTSITDTLRSAIVGDEVNDYIVVGPPTFNLTGERSTSNQFRVPSDDPLYGWIKAK